MAEKTEAPTPKKIKDARKKGDVAKSKDATSGATMIIAFAIIWASWESYLVSIKELILFPVEFYDQPFDQDAQEHEDHAHGLQAQEIGIGAQGLLAQALGDKGLEPYPDGRADEGHGIEPG